MQSKMDPGKVTFCIPIKGVTFKQLNTWCKVTRNNIEHFKIDGKTFIPGNFLKDYSNYVVEEIYKKYGNEFPIKNAPDCGGDHGDSKLHKIFLEEDLEVKLQVLMETKTGKYEKKRHILCYMEIQKTSGEIVFSGLPDLTGEKS